MRCLSTTVFWLRFVFLGEKGAPVDENIHLDHLGRHEGGQMRFSGWQQVSVFKPPVSGVWD